MPRRTTTYVIRQYPVLLRVILRFRVVQLLYYNYYPYVQLIKVKLYITIWSYRLCRRYIVSGPYIFVVAFYEYHALTHCRTDGHTHAYT